MRFSSFSCGRQRSALRAHWPISMPQTASLFAIDENLYSEPPRPFVRAAPLKLFKLYARTHEQASAQACAPACRDRGPQQTILQDVMNRCECYVRTQILRSETQSQPSFYSSGLDWVASRADICRSGSA